MPGVDFNGTGANTSKLQVGGQPGIAAGGAFTILACVLPDSAGQSNSGVIFQTATAGGTSRIWFRLFVQGSDLCLALNVARSLTATAFASNTRKIIPSGSTSVPCWVGCYFDDSASPKVTFFSTGDGTANDGDLGVPTNGTATAGTGTISGSDTVYVVGNLVGGGQTFDGVILACLVWPSIMNFGDLRNVAAGGMHPSMVQDTRDTNARLLFFDEAANTTPDLNRPDIAWTATALTDRNYSLPGGGSGWSPGSAGIVAHYPYAQALAPSAVGSGQAFGTDKIVVYTLPGSITSGQALGTPKIQEFVIPGGVPTAAVVGAHSVLPGPVVVAPTAIATAEAFGTALLSTLVTVAPAAIASAQAVGAATVVPGGVNVQPGGVATGEAFGTALLRLYVTPAAIASGEALGAVVVQAANVFLAPAPIATAEALGAATVVPGGVSVLPAAIASAQAVGAATVVPGGVNVQPGGVATGVAFGTALLRLYVTPAAIGSAEAFGMGGLNSLVAVYPAAIGTGEAVTDPVVVPGAVTVAPAGVPGAEALGALVVLAGGVLVQPAAIATAEAFGAALLSTVVTVQPGGIATAEAFGTALLALYVTPAGVGSGEAHGDGTVTVGGVTLLAEGIPGAEAFGTALLALFVLPASITSQATVGAATVVPGPVYISTAAIPPGEAFGTGLIRLFILPAGIATAEAFGFDIVGEGFPSDLLFPLFATLTEEGIRVATLLDDGAQYATL